MEFDTTKSALFNFLDTWLEPARFYADVQYVMALRMMRLALGVSPDDALSCAVRTPNQI